VGNELPLMIIPDSQAYLDGHTVLTYTYSIYKNIQSAPNDTFQQESELHLEKHKNPITWGILHLKSLVISLPIPMTARNALPVMKWRK